MFNEVKSILNDPETIKVKKKKKKQKKPSTPQFQTRKHIMKKNSLLSQDISFAEHQKKRKLRMGSRTKRQCPCLMKRCTEQAQNVKNEAEQKEEIVKCHRDSRQLQRVIVFKHFSLSFFSWTDFTERSEGSSC